MGIDPETVKKAEKDGKLPSRVDWISGNPKTNRGSRPDDDFEKNIFEIKPDQTIVRGTIVKNKDGLVYSGTFKGTDGTYKAAADLTGDDKAALKKDYEAEESRIKLVCKGRLASVLPIVPKDSDFLGCHMDDDGDGIPNNEDNCPMVYNPDQTDSVGDGVGDACRNPVPCDVNYNGMIDITDVSAIIGSRNLPAISRDPRDADGDGLITVRDARYCAQCAASGCPVSPPGSGQIQVSLDPPQIVPLSSTVLVNVYLSGVSATGPSTVSGAFDLTLQWDTSIIQLMGSTFGIRLGDQTSGEVLTDTSSPSADSMEMAEVSLLSTGDLIARETAGGTRFIVGTLYFRAIRVGTSPVNVIASTISDGLGRPFTSAAAIEAPRLNTNIRVAVPQ